ncbi:Ig-like domain-containing protein, partial [Gemella bergeri]
MKKKIFIWIATILLICSTILTTIISSNSNIANAVGGEQGRNSAGVLKKEVKDKDSKEPTEKKSNDRALEQLRNINKGIENITLKKRDDVKNISDNIINDLSRDVMERDNVIKTFNVTDLNGKPLSGEVEKWQNFKVTGTFELPNNVVRKGDTTTIKLPEQLTFGGGSLNFSIKDSKNNVVANALINPNTKTITLTYTDYPEKYSDVKGEFYFYARVDESRIKQEIDIDLNFTINNKVIISSGKLHYKGPKRYNTTMGKSGWQDRKDKSLLHYDISINRSMIDLKSVKIKDRLDDNVQNVKVLPNTIKIYKLDWYWDKVRWKYKNLEEVTANFKDKIKVDNDQKGFTIDLGDIGKKGYKITYDIRAGYTPADGEIIKNKVTLYHTGKVPYESKFNLRYLTAGGKAEGYVYSINLLKKDKDGGKALKGAEFQVTRDATGQVIGKFTTDADGKISIKGLLKDNYTIKETKAPDGYKLDPTEIKIGPSDFGSDKSVTKEVLNEKAKIKICGTKTWDDNNNQDGKRPTKIKVKLLADGKEVDSKEVTEKDDWKYSFDNLDKYNKDGKEIKYTVDEEVVEFYEKTVDGF